MKKIVFISLAACSVLAACSKNDLLQRENPQQQIPFDAAISKAKTSKALIDGTVYGTTNTFGTTAYKVEGATTELYIPVSEVSYTAGTPDSYWSTATSYYWPKKGTLTFYSYSPFTYAEGGEVSVNATKDGLEFKDYNVASHQLTDLMVAEKQSGLTSNTETAAGLKTGVKTVFHHKLAQVVGINFETILDGALHDYANGHDGSTGKEFVSGDKEFIINNVSFVNIYETGTLTDDALSSSVWSAYKDADNVVWHENTSATPFAAGKYNTTSDVNGYRLVLPQTHTTGNQQIKVEYTIKTYTDATNFATEKLTVTSDMVKLHSAWEQNKKYTYTIKMGLDRIYWVPSVVDWETGASNSIQF